MQQPESSINLLRHLFPQAYSRHSVSTNIEKQLKMAQHKYSGAKLSGQQLLEVRNFLLTQSAHYIPSSLAAFDGLGSALFSLYKTTVFEKLHVFDLGIISDFTDWIRNFFQRQNTRSLTKRITILNERYADISRAARLPQPSPFEMEQDDN